MLRAEERSTGGDNGLAQGTHTNKGGQAGWSLKTEKAILELQLRPVVMSTLGKRGYKALNSVWG